jgi:methylase of polypeptide subunit release factors
MIDMLVNEFKGKVQRVLDVGTGSGVDISPEALRVAEINCNRLRLK